MNRSTVKPLTTLLIEKAYEDAKVPQKAHPTDSGFDVFAHSFKVFNTFKALEITIKEDEVYLRPREMVLVDTGIKATVVCEDSPLHSIDKFNETYTYEIQVRPKSGLAYKHGLTVLNTPGTVDNSYTGTICVIMINHSDVPYKLVKGEKVAQIVPVRVELPTLQVVDSLNDSDRGTNGFGSTGKK